MDELSVRVEAPPGRVWELISDITRMGEWSPENLGGRWTGGAKMPAQGARFVGLNRHGPILWATRCKVIECEPPTRFAFEVGLSRMRWGFRLEPEGDGTRLTQWRYHARTPSPLVKAVTASGLIGRDRERLMVDGMRRTLDAVKAAAERHG